MTEKYFEVEIRDQAAIAAQEREARHEKRRRKARRQARIKRGILVAVLLVLVAVMVARALPGADSVEVPPATPTPTPTERVEIKETMAIIDPDMGLVDPGAAQAPTEEPAAEALDPKMVTDAIVEILLAQGYLSDAVPLPYEYQDYMRFFSAVYGCPYPVALAAADCETGGTFDMDLVGRVGEVGIFQLNPGPDGRYHADLEENTGMDPNTPMGNIAGGCYLLGKYMDAYNGDMNKVAMAYNMGPSGAAKAWEAGITSTEYSRKFTENVEKWEALVNAWRGI